MKCACGNEIEPSATYKTECLACENKRVEEKYKNYGLEDALL